MTEPRRTRDRRRVRWLAISCFLVFLSACGQDTRDPRTSLEPPGTPKVIDPEPTVRIGQVLGDPSHEFFQVVTPFVFGDGRLVVPQSSSNTISIFSAEGELLQSLGGRGSGPGEFRELAAAWPRGDTVEAYDFRAARITRFVPDGAVQVVRLAQPPAEAARARLLTPVPGALEDGWLFAGITSAGLGQRDQMEFIRYGRDGTPQHVVARLEGIQRFRTAHFSGPDPLSPAARFVIAGNRIYLAETLTPVIRRYSEAGQLEAELAWDPVSEDPEETFRTVVNTAVTRAHPDQAHETRARLEAFPIGERIPAFWDFRVDPIGFVWVRPFDASRHSMAMRASREDGEWWIFSDDGRQLGSIVVPEGLSISFITEDAVIGIYRDEMGVESVRVHRLERS